MKPTIIMIAAHDKNLGIGINNDLPWHISKDLQHFKKITLGKPVIMGRNTFDSIVNRLNKPLPDRLNIVITSRDMPAYGNVLSASSLQEAIAIAVQEHFKEVFIIGGAQLYTSALPIADKLYITEVQRQYECDAFFPSYKTQFTETSRIEDQENGLGFSWIELTRN